MKREKITSSVSGSVLPLVALMFLLLLMTVGFVLDIGRIYAVQTKGQNALDAALLGAVATADTSDPSTEIVNLFNADYPLHYVNSTVNSVSITQTTPGIYQASANITVPMVIMQMFNIPAANLNIVTQSAGGFQSAPGSLELAVVLDNSGSMGDMIDSSGTTKLDALKQAASSLMDILFAGSSTLSNVNISIVPFNNVVQIGLGHNDWITNVGYQPSNLGLNSYVKYYNYSYNGGIPGHKGFAMNREMDYLCGPYQNPNGYSFTCPAVGYTVYCADSSDLEHGTSGTTCSDVPCTPNTVVSGNTYNYSCPTGTNFNDVDDTPPTAGAQYLFREPNETQFDFWLGWGEQYEYVTSLAPMLFASNVKADIVADINSMQNGGDTRLPVGLMWGWFALSPKWQGLWDAGKPGLPASYAVGLNKSLVLMTDGVNDLDVGSPTPIDDNKTTALCNAIKSQGITIYTIGFGADDGTSYNPTLLKNCASLPTYYFEAPTTAQLQTVFHQIGDDVVYNTLHLTQ